MYVCKCVLACKIVPIYLMLLLSRKNLSNIYYSTFGNICFIIILKPIHILELIYCDITEKLFIVYPSSNIPAASGLL